MLLLKLLTHIEWILCVSTFLSTLQLPEQSTLMSESCKFFFCIFLKKYLARSIYCPETPCIQHFMKIIGTISEIQIFKICNDCCSSSFKGVNRLKSIQHFEIQFLHQYDQNSYSNIILVTWKRHMDQIVLNIQSTTYYI